MTKAFILLSSLIVISIGCATLNRPKSNIELSEIERLQMGITTSKELGSTFGRPDQVVPLSDTEEMWVYWDRTVKVPYQRVSFVIEKKKETLLTAAWIPSSKDSVQQKYAALDYFNKKALFTTNRLPLIAGHEYSNEVLYLDPNKGLSLQISEISHVVSIVGFSVASPSPLAKRE